MSKRSIIVLLVLALLSVCVFSCAKQRASWNQDGSWFGLGSSAADHVVINYAGTRIADVYILHDAFVNSPKGSDGWEFTNTDGNHIKISGDAKVIRIDKNPSELSKYHEYHMEFETRPYEELYTPMGMGSLR